MRKKLVSKWAVSIPEGAEVKVKLGQRVEKGDLLLVWESGKIERLGMLPVLSHFSKEQWQELRDIWVGKKVELGQVMLEKGGIGGMKLLSPKAGILKSLDEFGNMEYREAEVGEEVVSPTKGKVNKVEKEKLVLEFRSVEIKGEGLVEGKSWGRCDFKVIDRDVDLNYTDSKAVVMMETLEPHMVLKSEVVGVAGIITLSNEVESSGEIPILKVSNNDWDFLKQQSGRSRTVLLNTKLGRMLIVVE